MKMIVAAVIAVVIILAAAVVVLAIMRSRKRDDTVIETPGQPVPVPGTAAGGGTNKLGKNYDLTKDMVGGSNAVKSSKFSVMEMVTLTQCSYCNMVTEHTSMSNNANEYIKSRSVEVGLEVDATWKAYGASTSLSVAVSKAFVAETKKSITKTSIRYVRYIRKLKAASMSEEFQRGLEALPATITETTDEQTLLKFFEFFNTHGTHFVSEEKFGALRETSYVVTRSKQENSDSLRLAVAAKAKGELFAGGPTVGVGVNTGVNNTESTTSVSYEEFSQKVTSGGNALVADMEEWKKSVNDDNVVSVGFTVSSIEELAPQNKRVALKLAMSKFFQRCPGNELACNGLGVCDYVKGTCSCIDKLTKQKDCSPEPVEYEIKVSKNSLFDGEVSVDVLPKGVGQDIDNQ